MRGAPDTIENAAGASGIVGAVASRNRSRRAEDAQGFPYRADGAGAFSSGRTRKRGHMNTQAKRRLIVVTLVIVAVLAVILAYIGSSSAAKTVSVAEAADGSLVGTRVEVTGSVVDNSYSIDNGVLVFDIYDADANDGATVHVSYDGSAASTFGNGVQAICTGELTDEGGTPTVVCTELVTKCPSKYENASEALTVSRLDYYRDSILDKPVKVAGVVKPGTLKKAGESDIRFSLLDADDQTSEVSVKFDGGIPEGIGEGTSVVVTGSLSKDGTFACTDIAQEA